MLARNPKKITAREQTKDLSTGVFVFHFNEKGKTVLTKSTVICETSERKNENQSIQINPQNRS
jgi:hypothetical protein